MRWLMLVTLLAPAPGIEFDLKHFAVHGRRQDTLIYDFDGDGTLDVLNTSIDFDKNPPERWLALHFQRKAGFNAKPDILWSLSDRACALFVGDFLPGGGVEVGFLAEDGVYVYPFGKGVPLEKPIRLFPVRTFFTAPSLRQLPVWSWPEDLDQDGRHDLVVPLADGYRVYFQTAPGIFGRTSTLETDLADGSSRVLSTAGTVERLEVVAAHFTAGVELPRLEAVDINGDGRKDLVCIRKDTLTCFLQKKDEGIYPSRRPYRVSSAVVMLRDEVRKDSVNLSLIRFVDIDQDGLADLVVTKIEGTLGLWESIRTSIYLHIGTGRGNFAADTCIAIDGVSIDPEFVDMNLDGKLDAFTSRVRTNLLKQAVSAIVLGDISIQYEIFQFDAKSRTFLTEPVYEKEILVRKDDLEKTGIGAVPLVYVRGDLSGDGRPDMVVLDPKTEELLIHPGRVDETSRGPRIGFDGTPHWRIKVDRVPKGLNILDVNGDGINDVILYYSGAVGLVLSRKS